MTRQQNIEYLSELIEAVEGVPRRQVARTLQSYSDKRLRKDIEFYLYILEK